MGIADYVRRKMAQRRTVARATQGLAKSYAGMSGAEKEAVRVKRMHMDRAEAKAKLAEAKLVEATRQDRKAATVLRRKPLREAVSNSRSVLKRVGQKAKKNVWDGGGGKSTVAGSSDNAQIRILSGGKPQAPEPKRKVRRIIIEG